ncbi:membrane anchor subunit of succinate dehydrogenase, Sdh4 [Quaeritorhiza haematococci]|nr:membrane anchor subunit of succinate dehydrogenase, Sdh4 [Quaeritorhiza haematococci]
MAAPQRFLTTLARRTSSLSYSATATPAVTSPLARSLILQRTVIDATRSSVARVGFHSGRVNLFEKTSSVKAEAAAGTAPATPATQNLSEKSKIHGSYHWTIEKVGSLAMIPLFTSAFLYGPNPYVDLALGFLVPYHFGDALVGVTVDYLPARRVGNLLNKAMVYTIWGMCGLAMYGCYQFNTNDIGLTAMVGKLWNGPEEKKEGGKQ